VVPFDLSAAREELGFAPKFSFKDALKDYVEEMQLDPV